MRQQLLDTLKAVGKPCRIHETPDGSTVLVLPYGGRALGLFAPGSDENFYWTHPALQSASTAAEFYGSDQWQNSGGDRTWLAPEMDFFFPNFPKTDVYFQPRQLDPGNYQVVEDGGQRLVNRATFLLSRSKTEVTVEIAKSIGPTTNPLRYERDLARLPVEFAGYTQYTSMKLLSADSERGTAVGLWNLIQMPHGGQLFIPTYFKSQPKIIFGDIGPGDLTADERLIRYRMRSSGEQKIAIRAVAVAGRVGYCYPVRNGRWALVVRNIAINPSGLYCDAPWTQPDDLGYAIQACNVNSQLGAFSELEYHIPAIGPGTGCTACEDASQVWAFRGGREEIECVAGNLLANGVTAA